MGSRIYIFDITCKICGQLELVCAISQRRKKCRIVNWTSTTTRNWLVKGPKGTAAKTSNTPFHLYNKQVWMETQPLHMVTLDV